MKLTLTEKQIPLAEGTIKALCVEGAILPAEAPTLPGWNEWYRDILTDASWADALEAAITEAEHPMQVITLAKTGDADERAFWRAVFTAVHSGDKRDPTTAADQADEALARYRKAFCAGMPSDQKGSE